MYGSSVLITSSWRWIGQQCGIANGNLDLTVIPYIFRWTHGKKGSKSSFVSFLLFRLLWRSKKSTEKLSKNLSNSPKPPSLLFAEIPRLSEAWTALENVKVNSALASSPRSLVLLMEEILHLGCKNLLNNGTNQLVQDFFHQQYHPPSRGKNFGWFFGKPAGRGSQFEYTKHIISHTKKHKTFLQIDAYIWNNLKM